MPNNTLKCFGFFSPWQSCIWFTVQWRSPAYFFKPSKSSAVKKTNLKERKIPLILSNCNPPWQVIPALPSSSSSPSSSPLDTREWKRPQGSEHAASLTIRHRFAFQTRRVKCNKQNTLPQPPPVHPNPHPCLQPLLPVYHISLLPPLSILPPDSSLWTNGGSRAGWPHHKSSGVKFWQ